MTSWLSRIDNYVYNPSAEVNTTGVVGGALTVARNTSMAWSGLASFQGTITSVATSPYMAWSMFAADAHKIPVTPGQVWSASGRFRMSRANVGIRWQIQYFNDANANVGATYLGDWVAPVLPASGEWSLAKIENAGPVPAGATFMRLLIGLYISGHPAGMVPPIVGDILYADGIMASPNEQAPTYVDGSFGTYHYWLGTPHLSRSYRDPLPVLQTARKYGQTLISSELWLVNQDNQPYQDISTNAIEGKVSTNVHNAIKSALSLTVKDPELVRPYTDMVAPFLNVTGSDGITHRHQLGLYLCTPAKHSHRESLTTGNLEGRDLTWVLANDYFGTTYNVPEGENAIDAVVTILLSAGLYRYNIPDAGKLLAGKSYPPDKSKLEIVNDILNGAGYYTIWADRYGILTSRPYFELASAEPALQLFSGEGGAVIDAIEQEGVYETMANKVIVYKENTQGTPIVVRRTNTDPLSPVSTVNLGRTITRVIKDSNIADVTTARAIAKQALETGASFTNKLKVTTVPLPDRDLHEVYDLAIYNKQGVPVGFGLWWCDGTEIGFTLKTAKQTHNLKRLEPYDGPEEYSA